MSLRIYNTLSRQTQAFVPLQAGHVKMYVCGMTIYDLCHVGHARMMMAFDVVQRWLKSSGYHVTYVRNITDIDDKIINRALERGITIKALTDEMTTAMHQDIGRLGIEPPSHEPRATQYVPQMLEIIETLQSKGLAYPAPNGDVNYAVRKFPNYGQLSGKSLDDLRAGERVAVDDGKQDPLDFVLWKSAKPDEPEDAQWPSRYGAGRPGWHIECSAMSCALLGERFDIHGGGADLQFPHHENEIAQSDGAFHLGQGHSFVNTWMHNGFVRIDNEKMSKSLGNFFTIRDVLQKYDGETLRFFMIRTHYRSPLNYSDVHLNDARAALRRLYTALSLEPSVGAAVAVHPPVDWGTAHAQRFKAAMDEDFGTPEAIAVLFELAAEVNKASSDLRPALAAQLKGLAATLGLLQTDPNGFLQGEAAADGLQAEAIEALIAQRSAAKAAKDYARGDAIRKELLAAGIALKDSAAGTTWERV